MKKKYYGFEKYCENDGKLFKGIIRVDEVFNDDNGYDSYYVGPAFLYWPSVQPEEVRIYKEYLIGTNMVAEEFTEHDSKVLIAFILNQYKDGVLELSKRL